MESKLLLLMGALALLQQGEASDIKFNETGYTDVLIAIKDSVPELEGALLIQQIKAQFTKASKVLYKATQKRAHFKDIKIMIPAEWSSFLDVEEAKDSWSYETADIKVYNGAGLQYPKTIQSGLCGVQGNHILLPKEFVEDQNGVATSRYGPIEKSLVKEWSQFRYGVFDESGSYHNKKYPAFYSERGEIKVTSCTNTPLYGERKDVNTNDTCTMQKNGVPNQDCRFHVDPVKTIATSSLMSHQSLPTVEFFCEDSNANNKQHNRFVTNMQNDLCNRRSVWTVMTSHEDFEKHPNPPEVPDVTPVFTLVSTKEVSSRVVLTLDVSGSMQGEMTNLISSSVSWVENDFIANNSLGIVSFNHAAITLMAVQPINTNTDRARATTILKALVANGGTCINKGVTAAIQALTSGGEGGMLVLMTDGQNGCGNVTDSITEILAAKVKVFTIAFTASADPTLEYLATASGGKAYNANPASSKQDLYNAFLDITNFMRKRNRGRSAKIMDREHNITASIVGTFSIDEELSDIVEMRFIYKTTNVVKLTVTRPSGKQFDCSKIMVNGYFEDGMTLQNDTDPEIRCVWNEGLVHVNYERNETNGIREAGVWKYGIYLSTSQRTYVTVVVTAGSYRKNGTVFPDVVTASSRIYASPQVNRKNPDVVITAQVMYGENPVLDALALAKIEIENNPSLELQLLDNGNGDPDVEAGDGIYSGRLTEFPTTGRYLVKIDIFGIENVTYAQVGFRSGQPGKNLRKILLKAFLRQLNAGSINVVEDMSDPERFIPPGKITDLQINTIQNRQANLEWTAPGGSGRNGKVSEYIIKGSNNLTSLIDSFGADRDNQLNFTIANNNTADSGRRQLATVDLTSIDTTTLYIAVQPVNKYAIKGNFSNIAHHDGGAVDPTPRPPSQNRKHYNIFLNLNMNMSMIVDKTDE